MNIEKNIFNIIAFLSGCFPIAIVNFIINFQGIIVLLTRVPKIINALIMDFNWLIIVHGFVRNLYLFFAFVFLLGTLISAIFFYINLKKYNQISRINAVISDIRNKDIFSSGAIGFYVIPFFSFVTANDGKNTLILFILLILLMKIFCNNNMFLYTPMIDILGYQILECEVKIPNEKIRFKTNIIIKDGKKLMFTSKNNVRIHKISEGVYFAIVEK